MRIRVVWDGCCLVLLAMMGACSKSSEAGKLPPMEFEGVKVDTPRLMEEFVDASPQLQRPVNEAVTKARYKQYLQAMMALDQVLKSPELTEKQKKLIAQVIDQLKEVIAKAPVRPTGRADIRRLWCGSWWGQNGPAEIAEKGAEIRRLLNLSVEHQKYVITYSPVRGADNELAVNSRSLMQIMAAFASYMDLEDHGGACF